MSPGAPKVVWGSTPIYEEFARNEEGGTEVHRSYGSWSPAPIHIGMYLYGIVTSSLISGYTTPSSSIVDAFRRRRKSRVELSSSSILLYSQHSTGALRGDSMDSN
jgi:hypothetical protein